MSCSILDFYSSAVRPKVSLCELDSYGILPVDLVPICPKELRQSSVGDYYCDSAKFFIRVAADVRDYLNDPKFFIRVASDVRDYLNDKEGDSTADRKRVSDGLYKSLLPLGTEVCGSVVADRPSFSDSELENIAHGICVGYAPQRNVGRTTVIKLDSGFMNEYVLANLLYPYVMQPLRQLCALIPGLDPELFSSVIRRYGEDYCAGRSLPANLDFGYAFNYEFLSDFLAYASFCSADVGFPIRVQRQYWTPFFFEGDCDAYKSYISDENLLADIGKCYTQSKKLYTEIIKTGFLWEAQYAVLMGMKGRFIVSSNLGGILELVHSSNTVNYSNSALELVSDVLADLNHNVIAKGIIGVADIGKKT